MARKRQQYRRRPQRPEARGDGLIVEAINLAANRLASTHGVAELRLMVTRGQEARDWADQQAQQDPSPDALRRFRGAAQTLAEAERALSIAETATV